MILRQALALFQQKLADAGVENPILDARLLVAHALECERVDLLAAPDRQLSDAERASISALINRRITREPVARILGHREFWGLSFELNEATLEPRPDSETLIEAVLGTAKITGAPHSILDLGTGSGCLLLSLLHEWPHASGVGVDQSEQALDQASKNAAALGLHDRVSFQKSDWFDAVSCQFDLIISNPPYIPTCDLGDLEPEVREFDPLAALNGGTDGLNPYRIIVPQAPDFLTERGALFVEVGIGQAQAVCELFHESGFTDLNTAHDLGGIERVVSGNLKAP
ncbi:MAG: peptide chain release factor N(5)-glutamine methyltransferase [Bdellovibrionales bacterium]